MTTLALRIKSNLWRSLGASVVPALSDPSSYCSFSRPALSFLLFLPFAELAPHPNPAFVGLNFCL